MDTADWIVFGIGVALLVAIFLFAFDAPVVWFLGLFGKSNDDEYGDDC